MKPISFLLIILFFSTGLFAQKDTATVSDDHGIAKKNIDLSPKKSKSQPAKLKMDKKLNKADIKNFENSKKMKKFKNNNFMFGPKKELDKDVLVKKYWDGKDMSHEKLKTHQFLGTINSSTKSVRIECRDHLFVDGDRVRVYLNQKVVYSNIILEGRYFVINLNLENGYNRIDFQALNQGASGPNTAEFKVYDDKGRLISSKLWNLNTGVTATLVVLKN